MNLLDTDPHRTDDPTKERCDAHWQQREQWRSRSDKAARNPKSRYYKNREPWRPRPLQPRDGTWVTRAQVDEVRDLVRDVYAARGIPDRGLASGEGVRGYELERLLVAALALTTRLDELLPPPPRDPGPNLLKRRG